MGYLEFNRWAYDYYRSTTLNNGVCCLAIDEYEIDIFKRQYQSEELHFKEIKLMPWSKLLCFVDYGDVKIPMYFGLITLQCLAAGSMENSLKFTSEVSLENAVRISSGNFWGRFCDIAGIDKGDLINLYSEKIKGVPIQEVIWQKTASYLKDYLAFQLNIPQMTTGPGRYIQYPKSQVVLNKEDLKEIADKVLIGLDIDNTISEEHFYRLFLKEFSFQNFHRNNNKQNHEGTARGIFFKQVFNYYNSREWEVSSLNKGSQGYIKKVKYVIEFDLNNTPHFYDGINEVLYPYEVFKGGDIFLFEKVPGTEEFEQSKLFTLNTEFLIVSSVNINLGDIIKETHSGLKIFRCIYNNEEDIPIELKDRLRKNKDRTPVLLKGIRLSHTWQYIKNFGPDIIGAGYSILFSSFLNPREQLILENYDSLNCEAGIYTVRVAGFTSLRFSVLEQKLVDLNHDNEMGLRLNSFTIGNSGIFLKGLQLFGHSTNITNRKIHVNGWVKANLGHGFASANILLKSIKYTHYE